MSFQVILVVGQSRLIAPINAAGALNYDWPACTTTALADQIVVTLTAQPSQQLLARLDAATTTPSSQSPSTSAGATTTPGS